MLPAAAPERGGPAPRKTLTVFAAASLQGAFTEIGKRFEAEPRREGDVQLRRLVRPRRADQQGAPADVFASADKKNMDKLTDGGLIGGRRSRLRDERARDRGAARQPGGHRLTRRPGRSRRQDRASAPQVPCGAAAATRREGHRRHTRAGQRGASVTDVLGKVISGEADAGLVYVTDVMAAGDKVDGVAVPRVGQGGQHLPDRRLKARQERRRSPQAFVDYVTGAGRPVRARRGRLREAVDAT